jgi:hypothetical protein
MLKVEAVGTVYYTCELSDEEEEKVINYVKNNSDDFDYIDEETIMEAVRELWANGEIELYANSTESDYSTEEINWSEFEDRSVEEILEGIKDEED